MIEYKDDYIFICEAMAMIFSANPSDWKEIGINWISLDKLFIQAKNCD
jgi:hypothetical protein